MEKGPPGPIVAVLVANLALACYGPMVVHYGTGAINNAANMFFSYTLMSAIVLLVRTLQNPENAQRIWKNCNSPRHAVECAHKLFPASLPIYFPQCWNARNIVCVLHDVPYYCSDSTGRQNEGRASCRIK